MGASLLALAKSIYYSIVESTSDGKHLQSDLSAIERWSQIWLMQLNLSKCFVMRITRKSEPVIFDYKLMGHTLESAQNYPYLEVELSSTSDWSHYIDNKVEKTNKTLHFLRRNLINFPESIRELAYKALVRPHLEYASP